MYSSSVFSYEGKENIRTNYNSTTYTNNVNSESASGTPINGIIIKNACVSHINAQLV